MFRRIVLLHQGVQKSKLEGILTENNALFYKYLWQID
jgi:hypothetical protein